MLTVLDEIWAEIETESFFTGLSLDNTAKQLDSITLRYDIDKRTSEWLMERRIERERKVT